MSILLFRIYIWFLAIEHFILLKQTKITHTQTTKLPYKAPDGCHPSRTYSIHQELLNENLHLNRISGIRCDLKPGFVFPKTEPNKNNLFISFTNSEFEPIGIELAWPKNDLLILDRRFHFDNLITFLGHFVLWVSDININLVNLKGVDLNILSISSVDSKVTRIYYFFLILYPLPLKYMGELL